MDRIGEGGAMAARAQAIVGDDPAFATVLVEERKSGLFFYRRVQPDHRPPWEGYYTLWARIVPEDSEHSLYRLEYMRYNNRWQPLEIVGPLEDCVREIRRDRFHVFFG